MRRMIAGLLAAVFLAPAAMAVELGDDGLHKTDWMRNTFLDLREDLEEANSEGKRLMVMIEQRGCIYCTRMHQEIFPREEIKSYIEDNYFVVQMNLYGDIEITDFDGEVLPEKEAVRKWGVMFTPTIMFFPQEVPENQSASEAAVAVMPGAFEADTTIHMLNWVVEEGYDGDEDFQRYHARRYNEENP